MRRTEVLAPGVWLLSHHVDMLELTCAADQVPLLLPPGAKRGDFDARGTPAPCELAHKLDNLRRTAKLHTGLAVIDTDWTWSSGDREVCVELLPRSPRRGYAFALETPDWLLLVAHWHSNVPRLTFQLRADYLLAHGPVVAFEATRAWTEENVLPLIVGMAEESTPEWKVSRLDLAADVAGVSLKARDLDSFTTKSRSRREHHGDSQAVGNHRNRKFTGFEFGRRGGGSFAFARIYDKTLQADESALIRQAWARNGYDERDHGETVWRVEFEFRRKLLNELRSDGAWLGTHVETLLRDHLDEVWSYLVGTWLVLRESDGATRVERSPVRPWWEALKHLEGLSSRTRQERTLERLPVREEDPRKFLDRSLDSLASAAALNGDPSLTRTIEALRVFAQEREVEVPEKDFAYRVAKAEVRRNPKISSTRAAIRARAEELRAVSNRRSRPRQSPRMTGQGVRSGSS